MEVLKVAVPVPAVDPRVIKDVVRVVDPSENVTLPEGLLGRLGVKRGKQ